MYNQSSKTSTSIDNTYTNGIRYNERSPFLMPYAPRSRREAAHYVEIFNAIMYKLRSGRYLTLHSRPHHHKIRVLLDVQILESDLRYTLQALGSSQAALGTSSCLFKLRKVINIAFAFRAYGTQTGSLFIDNSVFLGKDWTNKMFHWLGNGPNAPSFKYIQSSILRNLGFKHNLLRGQVGSRTDRENLYPDSALISYSIFGHSLYFIPCPSSKRGLD